MHKWSWREEEKGAREKGEADEVRWVEEVNSGNERCRPRPPTLRGRHGQHSQDQHHKQLTSTRCPGEVLADQCGSTGRSWTEPERARRMSGWRAAEDAAPAADTPRITRRNMVYQDTRQVLCAAGGCSTVLLLLLAALSGVVPAREGKRPGLPEPRSNSGAMRSCRAVLADGRLPPLHVLVL